MPVVMVIMGSSIAPTDHTRLLALVLYFKLNGDMADPQPSQLQPNPLQNFGVRWQLRHNGMTAHRYDPAGHCPDMEVVNGLHTRNTQHPPLDLSHGDMGRH